MLIYNRQGYSPVSTKVGSYLTPMAPQPTPVKDVIPSPSSSYDVTTGYYGPTNTSNITYLPKGEIRLPPGINWETGKAVQGPIVYATGTKNGITTYSSTPPTSENAFQSELTSLQAQMGGLISDLSGLSGFGGSGSSTGSSSTSPTSPITYFWYIVAAVIGIVVMVLLFMVISRK
ncbi:MAG: hypothetical protein JRN37_06620 [Nitrososphaerota archaeon]|jgi:hypothetical protein|nr:hypothetical protein [Nitrososphaerota archaeon]MDG7038810.1 hypothetical protein [Nitrososphaerota archaeon]